MKKRIDSRIAKSKANITIHKSGRVEVVGLEKREEKKEKILKALLATGIDRAEIPALAIEVLAERIPMTPFKGLKVQEASVLNLTATALAGAML